MQIRALNVRSRGREVVTGYRTGENDTRLGSDCSKQTVVMNKKLCKNMNCTLERVNAMVCDSYISQ